MIFQILLITNSCVKTSVKDCNCEKLKIYGYLSENLHVPIRMTKNDVLELESIEITNQESIIEVIDQLKSLEKYPLEHEVDNRFVIEVQCKNSFDILVESNSYITKWDGQSYKPTVKFISIVKKLIELNECDKTVYDDLNEAIKSPQCVKMLYWRNQNLTRIPSEIFKMNNLEELDMGINLLSEVPDEISELKNLKNLHLSYNLISSVSSKIEDLDNLEEIWLLDNELSEIPIELCKLQKLKGAK